MASITFHWRLKRATKKRPAHMVVDFKVISDGNNKELCGSRQGYENPADCVHAVSLLFGSHTVAPMPRRPRVPKV